MVGLAAVALLAAGCSGPPTSANRNDLETMQKARITAKGTNFDVWLAITPVQQERGLMQVTEPQLAKLDDGAQRGMLFVFSDERQLSFWMYNTITALDIAYIRADGEIVSTYTMAPLETRLYPSVEPAQFALEVRFGLLAELGIGPGDRVEIPDSVLKTAP
jgi:uncharacterized protein